MKELKKLSNSFFAIKSWLLTLLVVALISGTAYASKPFAIPTFHCVSIYWSPEAGSINNHVLIEYRVFGEKKWLTGLPMRYNPIASPETKGDYRGSIVNLTPNTLYEISVKLEQGNENAIFKVKTLNENFPVSQTIRIQDQNKSLIIDQSGTENGYIVYDGKGILLDLNNQEQQGILVKASYVILRGFTIRNTQKYGILIKEGHHIVIEGCDISKWGEHSEKGFGVNYQGGIFSLNRDVHNLVIQRNKIHHPNWDSNSWSELHKGILHPQGPQAIAFQESAGNNIIRYNECWSDTSHQFNDVIGYGSNAGYRGFPGADSDIYGNYFANCWDDGIEAEGGNQNVRIWNNYIETAFIAVANAATSIGPLYVWRNVGGPGLSYFVKMGFAGNESWMTGHMYFFNNTVFQTKDDGFGGLGTSGKAQRIIKHCISRNNILQGREKDSFSLSINKSNVDNDFDYDLLSGQYPVGEEKNGIIGLPQYISNAGFSFESKIGNFQLKRGSPGFNKGEVIPNFADKYKGSALDMGAHQSGTKDFLYGINAHFIPAK
ncbi:MAG: right-handed parallel beta-helix repeat-containing protein [Ginsengibacter sp.]